MFQRGYQFHRSLQFSRQLSNNRNYVGRGIRYTFKAAFGKYLFVTNTVSCGVFMFLGDLLEQELQQRSNRRTNKDKGQEVKTRYDNERLVRMLVVGSVAGPLNHFYYKWANRIWPGTDMKSVMKKILSDQFIMSPLCIAQFFYTAGLLEKKTMDECNKEFQDKFLSVYKMDWIVWPPVQFLNFYFLPFRYQVFFLNTVTVIYNVFLSYMKHTFDDNSVL